MCGAMLPTGNTIDAIDSIVCTLTDNGMPCVIMAARDFGLTGTEDRAALDRDTALKALLEKIGLQVGQLMNLGGCDRQKRPEHDAGQYRR